jgi:hypothetical protein
MYYSAPPSLMRRLVSERDLYGSGSGPSNAYPLVPREVRLRWPGLSAAPWLSTKVFQEHLRLHFLGSGAAKPSPRT